MIERLQRTIEQIEQLAPEARGEAAAQLDTVITQRPDDTPAGRDPLELIGVWSDMPWEPMKGALDRIRHESQPTPPTSSRIA